MSELAPRPQRLTLRGRINPLYVIAQIADVTGLSPDDVTGPSRTSEIVSVRHAAMAIVARARPDLSLVKLGEVFGGRDHTTVLNALEKYGRDRPSRTQRPKSEAERIELERHRRRHEAAVLERRLLDDLVLSTMRSLGFWTLARLTEALDVPKNRVSNSLGRLKDRGVVAFAHGRWRLVR